MSSNYAVVQLTSQRRQTVIKATSLLDLPAEVRVMIWRNCRPQPIEVALRSMNGHTRGPIESHIRRTAIPTSPILLLNKTIHQESRPVIKNSFDLTFYDHHRLIQCLRDLKRARVIDIAAIRLTRTALQVSSIVNSHP
jgi:hypothetical protein